MSDSPPAISVSAVRKVYGATVALDDASITVAAGSVHALLGENGAGKSTMVKILSGLIQPNSGEIQVGGETRKLESPRVAQACGIQTAYLEMTQVRDLTVTQNLLLNHEPISAFGFLRKREAEELVSAHLERLGLGFVDPRAEVRDLDLPVRGGRVLLLYDPTRGVDVGTKHEIYVLIREFAKAGGSVLFFSSEIPELVNCCHWVIVTYRGAVVLELTGDELDEETIVRAALGEKSQHTSAVAH